ncbi:unnamed protein product [Sphagnum jensenii]
MSQTTSEPKVPVETKAAIWGAPVVSVIAYLVFLLALAVAYLVKNDNLLITLCGVAAANGTTVVNFWLGSSRGITENDKKEDVILHNGFVLSACTASGNLDTATIKADETLFANALAALKPLLPTSANGILQQIETAETAVVAAINGTPTAGSGQTVITIVSSVAAAIIGLFPGGGTAVTIAQAVLALVPEVAALFGLSGAPGAPSPMALPTAKALLASLPTSPLIQ